MAWDAPMIDDKIVYSPHSISAEDKDSIPDALKLPLINVAFKSDIDWSWYCILGQ